MFTGIVEGALSVSDTTDAGGVRRIRLDLGELNDWQGTKLGDSVAINGCCLTVAELQGSIATFEAIPETLRLTNLGDQQKDSVVNVERAMQAGARFDGHLVQGHVDSVGKVAKIEQQGGEWRITIECGEEFASQCIHKGSVCIDGISLTIAELAGSTLTVAIIPHTREVTNIRSWQTGTPVNLESDMIGKYVRKQLAQHTPSRIDLDTLKRGGYTP